MAQNDIGSGPSARPGLATGAARGGASTAGRSRRSRREGQDLSESDVLAIFERSLAVLRDKFGMDKIDVRVNQLTGQLSIPLPLSIKFCPQCGHLREAAAMRSKDRCDKCALDSKPGSGVLSS